MRLRKYALLTIALAIPAFAQQPSPSPMTSSAQASSDDALKLIALSAIMNTDPERGIPLVEGILRSNGATSLKDRAMNALAQNKSPRAQQVLTDYAKTAGDTDLQLRAIRYIGRAGMKDTSQQLAGLYASVTDVRAKQEILRSLMSSGSGDSLLSLARSEKDANLHREAIRDLANSDSTPTAALTGLYASETDPEVKRVIISSLLSRRDDAKTVIELARKETDPTMKAFVVQRLSSMSRNKDAMDFMMELLK